MNKIVVVATREFLETVKTKTFILSSVLVPLLILGAVYGTERIARASAQEQVELRTLGVLDESGRLAAALEVQVEEFNQRNPNRPFAIEIVAPGPQALDQLRTRVREGGMYAYLYVPSAATTASAPAAAPAPGPRPPPGAAFADVPIEFGRRDSQLDAGRQISDMIDKAVVDIRFREADPPINIDRIVSLQAPPTIREFDVRSGQESSGNEMARVLTPFAFMLLLFMGTLNISQGLLTSLLEEKSSRVIEVLLSAISPTQLMAGKILGMVGVGALLMLIWGGAGYYGAQRQNMEYLVNPYRLTHVVLYFVPGFLFISAFLAAVGSACNTLKEAQTMAFPLTICTIVPMMLWLVISQYPHSALSLTLSFIPPITPFVMILRICADPDIPIWQIVLSLALLWISVAIMIWAAGKVFRVGVLMYGKPPTPGELIRWLRYA